MRRRQRYLRIYSVIILVTVCIFSGCMPQTPSEQEIFYETVDDSGYTVRLEHKPQRIVSLNLGTDEILADMVEPSHIAAYSYLAEDEGLSSIVEKARLVPVKLRDRNAEAIIALKPDLVLMADSMPREVADTLREMGINVHVSRSPRSVQEVSARIESIAKLVGEEAKGQVIIDVMQKKLASVKAKIDKIPAAERQLILAFTFRGVFGREDGMFHEICSYAGVINGAAKAGLKKNQQLSKEQIVALNPDVFLLPTWSSDEKDDSDRYREEISHDPAYQTVKAVRNKRLVLVSDRYRYCISQHAADSVEKIARAVYPEAFS